MTLKNGSWKYDVDTNSFISLVLKDLKEGDIILSHHNQKPNIGLQKVLKVWIDDYQQVCYTLNSIY